MSLGVTVSLDKDFDTKIKRITRLQDFAAFLKKTLPSAVADRFILLLKKNWMLADTKYAALNHTYKKRKKARGLDERIWLATHTLIKNVVKKQLKGNKVGVSFTRRRYPGTKMLLGEIAASVEFGRLDKNQPPRPLWRDTFKELYMELPVLISEEIRKAEKVFFRL